MRTMIMRFYAPEVAKGLKFHTVMKNGKFRATLRRAPYLKGNHVHELPQGVEVPVYPIAALPGCPEAWVREQGTYVCPVEPEWGLWFDWTENSKMNTAIVPSVKGMNPITGQALTELGLHQYKEKCPVHDLPFKEGTERLCEECGYKWPPQSYVCAPNTLWWDGFRQPDGTVRQFYFSKDEAKDIASMVIGERNTVPAFGFGFFEPKVARAEPAPVRFGFMADQWFAPAGAKYGSSTPVMSKLIDCSPEPPPAGPLGAEGQLVPDMMYDEDASQAIYTASNSMSRGMDVSYSCSTVERTAGEGLKTERRPLDLDFEDKSAPIEESKIEKVAVAAGARIRQNLEDDTLTVDQWKDKPSATIRLYFVFKKQFEEIVAKGVADIEGDKEGYLKGLTTD